MDEIDTGALPVLPDTGQANDFVIVIRPGNPNTAFRIALSSLGSVSGGSGGGGGGGGTPPPTLTHYTIGGIRIAIGGQEIAL